jgi:VWFA-related protein
MMPSGISVLQEVTQDCSALVERLASWDGKFRTRCMPGDRLYVSNAGSDLGLVLYGSAPAPGGLGGPGGANPIYFGGGNPNWDYAILSLKAIGAIVNHLAGIPGRKNIIWLSNGFPVSDISYPYERDTLRAANQANVAIYSVEAQGLAPLVPSYPVGTAPSVARLASPTAPVGADVANMDLQHPMSQQWQMAVQGKHIILAAAQEALMEVSDRTGGRAFINTNDLTGAVRSAFDDSRTTYTLGFYPEEPRFDGKSHRLQVKVVGRPDVSLTYRRGYVDARGTGDLKSLLQDAVWSPLDGSGIALTARMDPGKAGYDLSVTIGPEGLSLEPEGQRWKATIHIVLVQNDDQGGRYDYWDQPLDLALRQDTYRKLLRKGLSFSQRVALNPKATSLRVIVLDEGSGNLGSLTIPVAPLKRSDNKG